MYPPLNFSNCKFTSSAIYVNHEYFYSLSSPSDLKKIREFIKPLTKEKEIFDYFLIFRWKSQKTGYSCVRPHPGPREYWLGCLWTGHPRFCYYLRQLKSKFEFEVGCKKSAFFWSGYKIDEIKIKFKVSVYKKSKCKSLLELSYAALCRYKPKARFTLPTVLQRQLWDGFHDFYHSPATKKKDAPPKGVRSVKYYGSRAF